MLTCFSVSICRTVEDGTCAFPKNFVGCDIEPFAGKVKYITDDIEIECKVCLKLLPLCHMDRISSWVCCSDPLSYTEYM